MLFFHACEIQNQIANLSNVDIRSYYHDHDFHLSECAMNREELISKLKELLQLSTTRKQHDAFSNAIRALETTDIPAWYIMNYVLDETGFKLTCKSDA